MSEINPKLAKWLAAFCTWERSKALGPLERRLLVVLWAQGPMTMIDMHRHVRSVAYGSLQTTTDRLYKKGLVTRERQGYANLYAPVMSRDEFAKLVAHAVLTWLQDGECYAALASDSMSSATRSDRSSSRSVTPAAIAGVTRSVL